MPRRLSLPLRPGALSGSRTRRGAGLELDPELEPAVKKRGLPLGGLFQARDVGIAIARLLLQRGVDRPDDAEHEPDDGPGPPRRGGRDAPAVGGDAVVVMGMEQREVPRHRLLLDSAH